MSTKLKLSSKNNKEIFSRMGELFFNRKGEFLGVLTLEDHSSVTLHQPNVDPKIFKSRLSAIAELEKGLANVATNKQ